VILVNFTEKRVKAIKNMPDGLQKSMEVMKSYGVKMDQLVYTMGRYDAVGICEAPNDESISKAALELASMGFVRTETLRGFTTEEMVKMVKSLP
jgi:uncharacterized protein with GYD domain